MKLFFEELSMLILCCIVFSLTFLAILNLYLIKRNGFYVRVNCWFCNGWSRVLYQNRNSFNCSLCCQYNGFNKDGSYNKVLKAQHNTSFVKYSQETENYNNGLCNYCNNNQQLKVIQLAKFIPLNENNYDIEIEHFRKQLENAYKLCKKCEKTLKATLDRQHSWLFGNRLKSMRKTGMNFIKNIKSKEMNKNSGYMKLIKSILIILNVMVMCNILKVKLVYPEKELNKYLPLEVFKQYKIILLDFYTECLKEFNNNLSYIGNFTPKSVHIQSSFITTCTFIGFCLNVVLRTKISEGKLWRINGIVCWIILFITSIFNYEQFFIYIFIMKLFSSLTLFYYYIRIVHLDHPVKEFGFKKLQSVYDDSLEEDSDEGMPNLLNVSNKKTHLKPTARKSTSDLYNSSSNSSDLNHSLDNLHLTDLNQKRCTSPVFSVNSVKRPILSPSKFRNVTQNPWTAGGFWKDTNVTNYSWQSNLSRSSSQSSGFVSDNVFRSPSVSSVNGEMDRVSVLSEPAYHFTPINPGNNAPQPSSNIFYYKAENNTFYPVLGQNSMLFIQNGIPHTFSNSMKHFDSKSVFSEKPISPLFRNLNLSSTKYRTPQC